MKQDIQIDKLYIMMRDTSSTVFVSNVTDVELCKTETSNALHFASKDGSDGFVYTYIYTDKQNASEVADKLQAIVDELRKQVQDED